MKQIKILFVMLALLLSCGATIQAQFGRRLGRSIENAAKNATIRKAEQKTDEAVSKGIDKATDPDTYKKKDGERENATKSKSKKTSDNTDDDEYDDAGDDADDENDNTPKGDASKQGVKAAEMAYAKSDFVPGDEIIFEDNQENEQLGEFPSQWDLTQGNAEIVTIDGVKCINLIGYTVITPLMNPPKDYLPDKYTLEWDYYVTDGKTIKASDMDLGIDSYNFFCFRLPTGANPYLNTHWTKPDDTGGNYSESLSLTPNTWHHVSLSFNQRALKIYVDGVRKVNAPNVKRGSTFYLFGREGIYIKNIRFAKGAVPLYDRMMTDGKIITYGITFDVGKSTIKPESMGEINRIVKLMQDNPDLKFSVEGHTDNTGNADANQALSEARSKAVVDKLIEMGIAKDRLQSAGKGQTSPLADNDTDEGRAKNRRVEFVKI
jgi:outer membrane protein OmpA-like peptidoglycan-associated protein